MGVSLFSSCLGYAGSTVPGQVGSCNICPLLWLPSLWCGALRGVWTASASPYFQEELSPDCVSLLWLCLETANSSRGAHSKGLVWVIISCSFAVYIFKTCCLRIGKGLFRGLNSFFFFLWNYFFSSNLNESLLKIVKDTFDNYINHKQMQGAKSVAFA